MPDRGSAGLLSLLIFFIISIITFQVEKQTQLAALVYKLIIDIAGHATIFFFSAQPRRENYLPFAFELIACAILKCHRHKKPKRT